MTDLRLLNEFGQIHDTFVVALASLSCHNTPDILGISASSRMHRHGILDKDAILRWHNLFATENLPKSGVNGKSVDCSHRY